LLQLLWITVAFRLPLLQLEAEPPKPYTSRQGRQLSRCGGLAHGTPPAFLLGSSGRTTASTLPAAPEALAGGGTDADSPWSSGAAQPKDHSERLLLSGAAGLVELRRIAEQGLAIRRFGRNERLGDSTIRRFGYCGWSAQPALLAVWLQCPEIVNYVRLLGCYYAPAVHSKAG
jgi:hypothetical protein